MNAICATLLAESEQSVYLGGGGLNVDLSQFVDPGLYLLWPDGHRLDLTRRYITDCTETMLAAPDIIPESVRKAAYYKPCDICPERERAELCHAIMPVLPFLADLDRYMSYDRVTAVYRESDRAVLAVVETSMQEALKYLCIFSVTQYCEIGHKFAPYFAGVNPLMPAVGVADAVYRNIFLDVNGDHECVSSIIVQMRDELLHTTRCQMERVKLVCKQDAFMNAYVSTYVVIQIMFEALKARHHEATQQG